MAFVVLITWFAAVLAGLYMLAVWLIENDVTGSGVTASRLPVTVVFGHLTLAVCGLGLWVTYLVLDQKRFAWAAIGVLAGIALLGFTMFARWIPVYREPDGPIAPGQLSLAGAAGPAEGNFPVAVVAAHGLFAVTTLILAILSALSSSATLSARPLPAAHAIAASADRATNQSSPPSHRVMRCGEHVLAQWAWTVTCQAPHRRSAAQQRLTATMTATQQPTATSSNRRQRTTLARSTTTWRTPRLPCISSHTAA